MTELKLNLKMFDEGGAPASSGDAGSGAEGGTEGMSAGTTNAEGGNSTNNTHAENAASDVDFDAEFADAIKKGGKYHNAFTQKANEVAQRATRASARKAEQLEAQNKQTAKLTDFLARMTGKEGTDIDGMISALQENNAFMEKYAMEQGMSVNEAKLKLENDMYKESEAKRLQAAAAEKNREMLEKAAADRMNGWLAEGEKVKAAYEGLGIKFDMQTELANPDFPRLLRSMGSVEAAFRAIHFDEIMTARENMAIQRTQEETLNSIKANRNRPYEGAVQTSKGIKQESNVSNLTAEDRARIAKEIARGENPFRKK